MAPMDDPALAQPWRFVTTCATVTPRRDNENGCLLHRRRKPMPGVESNVVSYAQVASGARTAADTGDRIAWIQLSLVTLPLATPVSDAKVLTGRQKPLTEIAFVFAEIRTRDGHQGIGFGYSKRAGGPGM